MKKRSVSRYIILGLVLMALMAALIYRLSSITLAAGSAYAEQAENRSNSTISIKGNRGRILDRNGVVLAYSKNSYNVEFLRNADNRSEYDSAVYTEALMKAIALIEEGGGKTIDTSYLRMEDGEIVYDWRVESKANKVARYRNFCEAMGFPIEVDETIEDKALWDTSKWPTAEESYKKLRAFWFIPEELTFEEANKIISIRQEVNLNNYRAFEPITIAYDVDMEVVAQIKLHAEELPGLQTSQSTTRVYPRGTTAAHLIGYLGRSVTKEMVEQQGYSNNDYIGVAGVEATMESYLTGATNEHQGSRTVEVNKNGSVIRELDYEAPTDGSDVMLTIDLNLQMVTEQALAKLIEKISGNEAAAIQAAATEYAKNAPDNDISKIKTAKTGAAVVMDIKNGQILAMASYPSFDPNWFTGGLSTEHYKALFGDENDPLNDAGETTPTLNKAISTKLAPGSIFKMVTGIAGVAEGKLGLDERISCEWEYFYLDENNKLVTQNAPRCHVGSLAKAHAQHSDQNLAKAIKNSCNYYFSEVAYRIGIERLYAWAEQFGLTSPTNVELTGEATGIVGKQNVLFDNTLRNENGELEISAQKTSLPSLIYRKLKEKLTEFVNIRRMEVNDEAIDNCARKLMELQDGSVLYKGDQIRQIISDEIGIPVGITQARTDWTSAISSLLTEIQWKPTQTLRSGFGQGVTLVTPVAVARYVSAIANEGTVYDAHIVDRVLDSKGNVTKVVEPTVYNQIDLPKEVWTAVKEGMKGVVSPEDGGDAVKKFSDAFRDKYLMDTSEKRLAGKTGTAQVGAVEKIDIENTSWFVSFAPLNDPEIAVVVCVPYGTSGSSSAPAIEDIFTYYFGKQEAAAPENLVEIGAIAP
ncbi:MAG: penicillin-binding transpeptidase domain-containing protein [Candidatus Pelethousia sp.]|nr:penicillin-binding transpeptidase domain-containing protein [Candidatus Pelethousia sp.]